MAEVDRRSRAILNSLKAARDERAAKAQEERQFMTSFNPNTAKREDFARFRENLKEQALKLANARPDGGIMAPNIGIPDAAPIPALTIFGINFCA